MNHKYLKMKNIANKITISIIKSSHPQASAYRSKPQETKDTHDIKNIKHPILLR